MLLSLSVFHARTLRAVLLHKVPSVLDDPLHQRPTVFAALLQQSLPLPDVLVVVGSCGIHATSPSLPSLRLSSATGGDGSSCSSAGGGMA